MCRKDLLVKYSQLRKNQAIRRKIRKKLRSEQRLTGQCGLSIYR
jgi:hypothetical protein